MLPPGPRADVGAPPSGGVVRLMRPLPRPAVASATAPAAPAGGRRRRARRRGTGPRGSRRRCSIRTSGRPRSATASRTMSYGRSSVDRDEDGPAVRPTAWSPRADERPRPAPSRPPRPRPRGCPVRSVKAPSGAARSRRPASIATRKSQTRSISPSRWLATMTAIPNSVPVRRTSAEHLVAAGRVEAVGRLVEQQQPRVVDERLGELDPLLHPGRVAADRAVALLVQADVAQDLGRPLAGRRRRAGRTSGPCG